MLLEERKLLGVWDCHAEWDHKKILANGSHQWLLDNVVGDVDLDYTYRVEFYRNHMDPEDEEHVIYTAKVYRFAKNEEGQRYIIWESDTERHAALLDPIEVILKSLPPKEMR